MRWERVARERGVHHLTGAMGPEERVVEEELLASGHRPLMRYPPPTRASIEWTLPVNPCGGNHLTIASGSRNARYNRSAGVRNTRWSRTVFEELDMADFSCDFG